MMTWLEGLSDSALKDFIDATSDLTSYRNVNDLVADLQGKGIEVTDELEAALT